MLQPSADVVYRRLGDMAVLVHLATNEIFELNDTGARIWELIVDGTSIEAVIVVLGDEFSVDAKTARVQCDELIETLTARQLIQTT